MAGLRAGHRCRAVAGVDAAPAASVGISLLCAPPSVPTCHPTRPHIPPLPPLPMRHPAGGGEVHVFSGMHASGEQLNQLTGIAAILRFPLPDLEDAEFEADW